MIRLFVVKTRGTVLLRVVPGLVACLLVMNCRPAGRTQLPLNQEPFAFVDAQSGAVLEQVLIIPKYSSSKGVSSGAGHGPGYMTHSSFLAFPFVYRPGTPFTPTQPDSRGLLVGRPGDLFVGHGVNIQGVIVIAQAYQPAWIWQLWDRSPSTNVPLHPLPESEAREQNRRLQALFGMSRIRGVDLTESELEIFSTIKDSEIDVRFSSAEQQLVRDFLAK